MKPEKNAQILLSITRSKAKMYEYDVPPEHHIAIKGDPARLLILAISILGELAANINEDNYDHNNERISLLKKSLVFSAQFFDVYLQSKLNTNIDPYLILLGSASYYLADLPGSSILLANYLPEKCPDLKGAHLEDLLLWLLKGNFSLPLIKVNGPYSHYIDQLSKLLCNYYDSGVGEPGIQKCLAILRKIAYGNGSDRELLFVDIACAITKKRIKNSSWSTLPKYSNLNVNIWSETIRKKTFIKELWPSQQIIGEHGILRGISAIIHMPTSAGKTRATEIIIRSAFLSNRASMAILVAPFRALCHEIRNGLIEAFKNENIRLEEISDVPQIDYEDSEYLNILPYEIPKRIWILTPEKLLYILRQTPALAQDIGLLIYDEGHQFDNGLRGVTFELLLSSLKSMIAPNTQTILISAVINNADIIGQWLYGKDGIAVLGNGLLPTYRTIAFASWKDNLGRLEFVDKEDPERNIFYVPRVIEQIALNSKKGETSTRYFPSKADGKSIALYLGIKLSAKGSVAIFCGLKSTVVSLCKDVVDYYDRGLTFPSPDKYSNHDEVDTLYYLHQCHLGESSVITQSAKLGIYAHNNHTPQGLRLAVEYAMQKDLIKFVICTSTLAQGVNLPIRYLILPSIYQAGQAMKVRDFHNLIGRAGRSGKHTEGSIIFADPKIYDHSHCRAQVKKLLNPSNAELCVSAIQTFFEPIYSQNRKNFTKINPLDYARMYTTNPDNINHKLTEFVKNNAGYAIEDVLKQAQQKSFILSSIESYLLAHWEDFYNGMGDIEAEKFAKNTLAYQLCNNEQQENLIKIFQLLAQHIKEYALEVNECKAFGRTLYGLNNAAQIKKWVIENADLLRQCESHEEILNIFWPFIFEHINNATIKKIEPRVNLQDLIFGWIEGRAYYKLHEDLIASNTQNKAKKITLEHIIEVCDKAIAYDATLLIGAIAELFRLIDPFDSKGTIKAINELQKRLKYGLPSLLTVALYEIGFSDRVIAMELSTLIKAENSNINSKLLTDRLIQNREDIELSLIKYPLYYRCVLNELLS